MSIFNESIEINGKKYKRINMVDGIKLQGKLMKCISNSSVSLNDLNFSNEEEGTGKIINIIISIIAENVDFIQELIEIFYDGDINTLQAGDEYDIIFDLVEHIDIKRVVTQLKNRVGKIIPQK